MAGICYAYRRGDVYNVTPCDDRTLGLLSDQGFLFFHTDNTTKTSLSEFRDIYKKVKGGTTSGDRHFLETVIPRLLAEVAKPYFRQQVEVPKKGTMVSLLTDPDEVKDFPKQAIGILVCLNNCGGVLEKSQLLKFMEDYIQTRQPMSEIFRFYQKKLIAAGHIEITEVK